MYEAGKDDKEYASKAYYRSDCTTNTLCILVKMEPGTWMEPGGSWFKDYGITQIKMIGDIVECNNDAGVYVGWEGCFKTSSSDDRSSIEIHANYANESGGGRTTSTGKKTGNCASMDIPGEKNFTQAKETDPDSDPEPEPQPEPESEPVPEPAPEPQFKPQSEPQSEPQSDPGPEPEPEPENDDPETGLPCLMAPFEAARVVAATATRISKRGRASPTIFTARVISSW